MNYYSRALGWTLTISLILIAFILAWVQHGFAAKGDAVETAPIWHTAPPGQRLSNNSSVGADSASVAYSPDGSRLMVVYSNRVSGTNDRDPYFRVFNGQNWTSPAPVHISAGTDSAQLAVTYDSQNRAHLIWEEPDQGLVYSRYNGNNWTTPKVIAPTDLRIFGTSITASGNQRIDVVWGGRSSLASNPNIYHARSTDGGNSWSSPAPIAQTNPQSRAPKVISESSGKLHVVWQERTLEGHEILYSTGPNWTTPVAISPPSIPNANQPSIIRAGDNIHVVFARFDKLDEETTNQWAYHTSCKNNCTNANSWSNPNNISGQAVRVNESAPFDLISDLVAHSGCLYVFFHGYIPSVSNNEVIWNVNSCDGWSSGERDQVTGFNMRGIYPKAVVRGNTVRVIYEWIEGPQHQIYMMQGELVPSQGGGTPGPGTPSPPGTPLPPGSPGWTGSFLPIIKDR